MCQPGHWLPHGPLCVGLERRAIGGEIHHLAVRRHRTKIGRDPGWSVLLRNSLPLGPDFPALRLGFQFPTRLDQNYAATSRKKIFQPPTKLLSGLKRSIVRCPTLRRVAPDKKRGRSRSVLIGQRVFILAALHLVPSARIGIAPYGSSRKLDPMSLVFDSFWCAMVNRTANTAAKMPAASSGPRQLSTMLLPGVSSDVVE